MKQFSIFVEGEPRTFSNDELGWREKVAGDVKRYLQEKADLPLEEKSKFKITLEFYLKKHRLFGKSETSLSNDLDNLAKPVLDSLFSPQSNLTNQDDTYVTELILRKKEAVDGEGVWISIELERAENNKSHLVTCISV